MPHISIKAEPLFSLYGFSITNSLLTSWIVVVLLIILAYLYSRKNRFVYQLFSFLLRMLYGLFTPIFGEHTEVFFPLVTTYFIYIFLANWFGLLPGVGSVGFEVAHKVGEEVEKGFVPIFRGSTADLNTTLALSILAIILVQYYGIKYLGIKKYLAKFINLTNPIKAFVGLLEIISEISKMLSFSFRLFGNIFAGEVLLTVVAFLVPVLASFPFLLFEFFVGFIQALVFSMLLSIFLSVAVSNTEH